eukprot:CAMPEP_0170585460 /NCGR_PEP_ID=MMETSP0224-20130122/9222_1 /TAXON_ID=285029 /ORGANISM="Togula jolla, Strain CCCM 725" /LENGTH=214 /DNA_ID=CAMNT_0010908939 /DNA_START=66 /DNA_END=710 /DNA_ORIENTATION=-
MCAAVGAVVARHHRHDRVPADTLDREVNQVDHIVSDVRRKHIDELIRKHGFHCEGGRLSRENIIELLTDSNNPKGTPPTDEEAEYIIDQCGSLDGSISLQRIPHVIALWQTFCKHRSTLEKDLAHSSHTGKMDLEAFTRYLVGLNHGEPVSGDFAERLLREADGMHGKLPQDGLIGSAPELALATMAWYDRNTEVTMGASRPPPGNAKACCALQ